MPRTALEDGEQGLTWPVPVPGGSGVLVNARLDFGVVAIYVNGQRRTLLRDANKAQFSPTGHLLFWRAVDAKQVDLLGGRIRPARQQLSGSPVSVLSVPRTSLLSFRMSPSGTLAYRAGDAVPERPLPGGSARRPADTAATPRPALERQPDHRPANLALMGRSVVSHEVAWAERFPAPRGGHRNGRQADSGHGAELLGDLDARQPPRHLPGPALRAWRGRYRLEARRRQHWGGTADHEQELAAAADCDARTGAPSSTRRPGGIGTRDTSLEDNIRYPWLLPLSPRGEPRPLLRSRANEKLPDPSRDGRWLVYVSDESGREEVWVRAFPTEGSAAIRVSQSGGTEPVWAPDGKTLYYRDASGLRLFAAPVTYGAVPQFGAPVVRTGRWEGGMPFGRLFDITPDGRALLCVAEPTMGRELRLIFNFDEVIRRRMSPVAR